MQVYVTTSEGMEYDLKEMRYLPDVGDRLRMEDDDVVHWFDVKSRQFCIQLRDPGASSVRLHVV